MIPHCSNCDTPLPDPVQRFGPVMESLCWECYSGVALPDTDDMRQAVKLAQEGSGHLAVFLEEVE